MSALRGLCRKHTDLRKNDIDLLEKIAEALPTIADLVRADVFIDCITKNPNDAIVVAEAKPTVCDSMYKETVVGELALRKNEPAALRTLETGTITRDLKALTQENMDVNQNVAPIKNDSGRVIGVLIMEQDITGKLNKSRHMEMLTETNEQLTKTLMSFMSIENSLTYHIDDSIVLFNKYGITVYANPVAENLYRKLGYKNSIIGMHHGNLAVGGNSFEKAFSKQAIEDFEIEIGNMSLQVKYVAMKQEDETMGLVMMIKDITDFKEKERELISKSVAIKEIHHRVKNNIQTIASLLRLQARRVESEYVKKIFEESISRIMSIAVTHEILAQKGVDEVDLKDILFKIKENTLFYKVANERKIIVRIKGDSFLVNSDTATSIALVVNELLHNALEHGFKEKTDGLVEINIQKGHMYSNIIIIDNGSGFSLYDKRTDSLGLNLVKSIVKDKLRGNLSISSNANGTTVVFDFKN
ncbi:MAG: histidine kinase N-terminal domain-containing protein [Alkaliphilus sp.]